VSKWWEAYPVVSADALLPKTETDPAVAVAEKPEQVAEPQGGKWWESYPAVRADVGPDAVLSGIEEDKKLKEDQARLHEAHQSVENYGEVPQVAGQIVTDTTSLVWRLFGQTEHADQLNRESDLSNQVMGERDRAYWRADENPEGMSTLERAGQYVPFLKQGVRGAVRSLGSALLGAKGAGALTGAGKVAAGAATGAARGAAARGAAGVASGAVQGAGAAARGALAAPAGGSAYGAIGLASGQEANRAITEGADAGLDGSALAGYVASQGLIEALPAAVMQRMGLGGVEAMVAGPAIRGGIKAGFIAAIKATGQEIPEELETELLSAVSAEWKGVDKEALDPDRLSSLVADTVLQTVLMGAGAGAMQTAQGAAQARLARLQEMRAKGFVSAEDAAKEGIEGKNRKERLANTDKQIGELTQQAPTEGSVLPNFGTTSGTKQTTPTAPTVYPSSPPAAPQPATPTQTLPKSATPEVPAEKDKSWEELRNQQIGSGYTSKVESKLREIVDDDGITGGIALPVANGSEGFMLGRVLYRPDGTASYLTEELTVDFDKEGNVVSKVENKRSVMSDEESRSSTNRKALEYFDKQLESGPPPTVPDVVFGKKIGDRPLTEDEKAAWIQDIKIKRQRVVERMRADQVTVDPERDQAEDELAGLLGDEADAPTTEQKFKFGQVIPAEDADRVVSELRAGDERSKNKGGGKVSEGIKEPLVVSTVPLSEFENTPDPDYGTYMKFLESSTDPARVESYAKQKIDTPVFVTQARDTGQLIAADGGHRIVAAMKRGDTEVPALVPIAVHERFHPTPTSAGPSEEISTKPTTGSTVVSPDAPATPETSMGETGKGQSSEARADEHAKLPMFSVYPTTLGGKEKFAVKEFENKGFGDSLFDTEAEATKQAEIAKRQSDDKIARQEKAKADEEATVKKQQEYEGSFQGFLSDTPMVKGRQLSTLGKQRSYQGKVVTVKELIEQKVADGAIVNDDGQLESADGAYLGSDKITKIGIDYARHLIASKPVPAVDAESQGTAESPTDADIDRAIGNFKKSWGMEATATPVDKLSADQQEALDFATSRGQKMAFVDIAKSDKKAPIGSFQRNEKVVLISNELKGDKLWGMIGHEMAHSKGLDEILPADSAELKTMMDEYFQSASPDVQKRLKTSKRDHQREGRARMVQKFFEDKAFRDQLKQDNPTMWEKLREAVLKFIGQWTPKDEAKRMLLDELRAAPKPEKSKGKKPQSETGGWKQFKPDVSITESPDLKRETSRRQKKDPGFPLDVGSPVTVYRRNNGKDEMQEGVVEDLADAMPANIKVRLNDGTLVTPLVTDVGPQQAKPQENLSQDKKPFIRKAVDENGGYEKNSADDVEAIRRKLYDGANTPSHADIRAVMQEMKNEAGEKPTKASADQVNVDSGAESKVKPETTESDFDAEMEKLMAGLTEPESGLTKPPKTDMKPEKAPRKPRSAKKQPAPAKTPEEKSAEDRASAAAKKAAAKQAMLDAFKGTKGRPLSGFDPEIGMNVARATKLYIEAGALDFRAFIRDLITDFGKAWVEDKAQYFESAWRTANKLKWIDSPTGKVADVLSEETDVDTTRDDNSESMGDNAPEPNSQPEKGGTTDEGTGVDQPPSASGRGDDEGTGIGSNEDSGGNRDGVSGPAGSLNNHQIAERPDWLEGGPVTKLNRNIDAITTMNRLEAEKRRATPDEQAIIAKYTGWGHLKQFFIRDSDLRAIKAVQGDKWNLNAFKTLDARTEEQIRDRGRRKGDSEDKIEAKIQREKANNKHRINLATSMNPAEYAQARKSTRYSHYTDPAIARAMWGFINDALPEAGKIRILEPSEGSGMFWGTMPDSMFKRAEMHGIDMDPASSRVAKHLYPSVRHLNIPFQQSPYPEGFFDLAITNVPFNKNPVQDPNANFGELSLHNYFFAKTAGRLREGGVVAFITTHFTMDASSPAQRIAISNQGLKFLGAVRLNQDAFGNVANTKVVTDIIIMQKVDPAKIDKSSGFDNNGFNRGAQTILIPNPQPGEPNARAELNLHPYFTTKASEKIAGQITAAGSMRGPEPELTVESSMTPEETAEFISRSLAKVAVDKQAFIDGQQHRQDMNQMTEGSTTFVPDHLRNLGVGRLAVDGTNLVVRTSEETMSIVKTDFSPTLKARADGWFAIRDALLNLQQLQVRPDNPESEIEAARKELNRVYDEFVGEFNEKKNDYTGYKPLNTTYNKSMFAADYTSATVQALENTKLVPTGELDKDGKEKTRLRVEKASIFTERTEWPLEHRPKPKSVKEALAHSMFTNGGVDIDWIATTLDKSKDEVAKQLEKYAFELPNEGGWEINEVYLSGNIAKKLEIAEDAAQKNPAFTRNVDALREVLPVPKTFEQLKIYPNSPFLPVDLLRSFVSEVLGLGSFDLYRNDQDLGGGWRANYDKNDQSNRTTQDTEQYAVRTGDRLRRRGFELFLDMIAGKPTIIVDRDADDNTYVNEAATNLAKTKRMDLSRAFDTFVRSSQERMDAVTNEFNRLLSGYVKPSVPDWVVSFDGMSSNWKDLMRSYQKEAAAKIAMGGNTLLAHRVGYGKTLSGVAGVMEQRRLGVARKPIVVVPNHLTGQWAKAFADFYPSAKIMAPTAKDFDKNNRQATMNRIMTGNWDAVIIPEPSFKKLPMSSEYVEQFFQQQIAQSIDAAERARAEEGADPRSIAELEDVTERLRNQLKKYLAESQKDSGPFFDEMGIDSLTVDEAHHYKNLPFYTQNTRVAGINPTGSQQAFDMLMKTDFINTLTGSRNVTFLTGTPIANSMTEAWVMMRYLMPETLKESNVFAFDDWKNAFGEVVDRTRVNTIGTGFRTETRFQQFVNLDVLAKMFQQVADIQMVNNDVQVPPLSGGKPRSIVVPASDAMKNFMLGLAARSANMPKDNAEDNMLNVMTVGAGAAIDFRLLDAAALPSETNKITVAADEVARVFHLTTPFKGTQIIWADRGVPKAAKKLTAEMKQLGAWMLEEIQSRPLTMEDVKEKWKELRPTKNSAAELQRFMGMALQDMNYTTGSEEDEASYKVDPEDEPTVWINEITDVDPNITEQAAPPWNVYQQMKTELVARGIPENQIAFIHDYKTAAQKVQLWEKMNNGDMRVLLGNTPRLGTGANIQQRLVAAHHLDVPWKPSDVEQRDGRIIRSGNRVMTIGDKIGYAEQTGVKLDGVMINRYVTEGSIDARYWDTNEMKASMLQDFWSGNPGVSIEELGATTLSMSDVKAAAVANPLLKRKIELEHEVTKLSEEYRGAVQSKTQTTSRLSAAKEEVPEAKKNLETAKKRVAWWNESKASLPEGESFAVEIDGETLFRRDDIAKAIDKKLHEIGRNLPLKVVKSDGSDWAKQQGSESSEAIEIGKVFGKSLKVIVEGGFRNPETGEVVGGNTWQEKQLAKELKDGKWERSYHEAMFRVVSIDGVARFGTNSQGFAARLRNFAEPTDTWVQDHERALASKEKALAELQKLADSIPDPDPTQLQKLQQELEQVSNEIGEEDDDQITYWVATEELEKVLGEYTLHEQLGRVDSAENILGYIDHPEYGKLSVFNRAGETRPPAHAMVYVEGENATIGYQPRDDEGVMGLPILKPRKMLGKIQHPEHGELLVFNHKEGDVTQPGKVWVESEGGQSFGYQDKELNVVMGVEMQKYEGFDKWPDDVKQQTSLRNKKLKKDEPDATITRMGQYVLPEMPGIVGDIDRQDFVRKYSDRALEPLWGWSNDPADADAIQEAIDTVAPSVSSLMSEIYAGKFKDLSEAQDSEAYDKATVAASETDMDATILSNLDDVIQQAISDKPKPRTKLGKLADKANKELSDAIDGLANTLKRRPSASANLPNPEVIAAAAKVVAKAIKAGTLSFAALMERMVLKYGEKMAKRMEAALQQEWDRQTQAKEDTTANQPEASEADSSETTSTKHAKTDELRAKRGLPERVPPAPETFQEWEDEARRKYPDAAARLRAIELAERHPERVGKIENAAIGQHIVYLENRRDAGEDVSDELLRTIKVANVVGSEAGRALASRKAERYGDFSLAGLINEHISTVGEDPTGKQMEEYAELADRIKQLEADKLELAKKLAEESIARQKAEAAAGTKPKPPEDKKGTKREKLKQQASEAVSQFKTEWATLYQLSAVYDPKREADKWVKITHAAGKVIKSYAELNINSIIELLALVKRDMGALNPFQVEAFEEAWATHIKGTKVESPLGEDPDSSAIGARAKELMAAAIEAGYGATPETWMEVVGAVHSQLSIEVPGISETETMQAMSDYGVWRPLNKDEVAVKTRAIRGKVRQSLKIEDTLKAIEQSKAWLASGMSPEEVARRLQELDLLPKATGREQATPDSIERELIAEFNKLKKELPVSTESIEGQLKSALSTAKTAGRNRLEMLDRDIEALEEAIAKREELEKPVDERIPLKPDADLIAIRQQLETKRKRRDDLKAEYETIFPPTTNPGRKQLTDAQRLAMSEKMLQRQIDALKADTKALEAGTWTTSAKTPVPTSATKEALKVEIESLKDIREQARKASPAYQAREEAKYWEQYRKAQERRLAFWEKRRDEAEAGRLPVPRKKRTPTENAILDKNLEIEKVQYEAMHAIEKANRATWNTGQWIGQGLLEATSLIPKSLQLGLELSFFKRQGFFYGRSHPIKAFMAAVEAIPAVFSQRLALASMEDIESRPNAKEYHLAQIDFTQVHGPKAKLEEMFQSSVIQWLESTEGKLFLPLRTWAKLYAAFERGNRTFANIMKADLYDIQKRDTLAAREFFGSSTEWTENDIKQAGRTANIFSGRGTGIRGGNPWLDFLFLARRWAWSRIQADFVVPFQLMTPKSIGQWNADRGMRVALAKLYIQTLLGHATKLAIAYWVYMLLAGDDEEKKPTLEFDPRSSDAGALRIGETRLKDEGGLMPAIVLASRIATGTMKTSSGEIKSIYGEDVQWGGKTAADFIIDFARYKLGSGPSAILEWASGRDAIGNVVSKTDIVTSRLTPLTAKEIVAAEKELGVKQGTMAALDAFFGVSVSTYGPRTKFREANATERQEQIVKDLNNLEWDSPPPAYAKFLTKDQLDKFDKIKQYQYGQKLEAATSDPKSESGIKEKLVAIEAVKSSGVPYAAARQAMIDHWKSPLQDTEFREAYSTGQANRLGDYKGKARPSHEKGVLVDALQKRIDRLQKIYQAK